MPQPPDNPVQPDQNDLWSKHVPYAGSSPFQRYVGPVLALSMILLLALGLSMIYSATISKRATPIDDEKSTFLSESVTTAPSRTHGGNRTSNELSPNEVRDNATPLTPQKPKRTSVDDYAAHYFKTQLFWIVCGLAVCAIGAFWKLDFIYRRSHWWFIAILIPLTYLTLAAATVKFAGIGAIHFFPFASYTKGAARWLHLPGGINIQPSEFAKVFLIIFLAAYYGALSREKIKDFIPGLLIPLFASGAILALIFLGKDLSTTLVTGVTAVGIMFLAGARLKYIVVIIAIGITLLVAGIAGSPMRRDRIVAWQHPEEARNAESYQSFRSQICLGVGSLTGKGYSKGYMKTYLPESHTDFIIAVIGEELGLVGLLGVLACYVTMCGCILTIGHQCRRREDLLLCNGIALLISTQALVNIGVVSGALPNTGVTAPFLSYGGSSLVSLMFLLGLVFNVAQRNYTAIWNEIGSQRCLPVASKTSTKLTS